MNIRVANPDDLKDIVNIYNQAITAGQRTADLTTFDVKDRIGWFTSHDAERHPILVADTGRKVIGYLSISPYREGRQALRQTAEVSYYVDFECHGQGTASLLMRHALTICPALGIRVLFAILLEGNDASIRLLNRFGFEKWGFMPGVATFEGVELGHLYYGRHIMTGQQGAQPGAFGAGWL
jgi:phosphinothricin acetyltransferase